MHVRWYGQSESNCAQAVRHRFGGKVGVERS